MHSRNLYPNNNAMLSFQGHPFTLDLIQWILVRDPERRPSLDDIDKRQGEPVVVEGARY